MDDVQGRRMSWLPVGTVLGDLHIDEVFVDYDGPRLFSARSLTDQMYLAEWAGRIDHADLWLYVPVSSLRLDAVRSGELPARRAFEAPEGFQYMVTLDFDTNVLDQVSTIAPTAVLEQWLPAEDFRLQITVATHAPAGGVDELARKAKQEGRARFRLEFDSPIINISEGSTRKVAATLQAIQNVFDNFGLAEQNTDPQQDGRFAKEVQAMMDTNVADVLAASFVIELGAASRDDLLGESLLAKVSERLVRLMSVQIEPQKLLDELYDLKPRAAKSFRTFVGVLETWHSKVVLATASTSNAAISQSLTYEQIDNLKKLLGEITPPAATEIRGRMILTAGDVPGKQFGLLDPFDKNEYAGKVREQALSQIEHAKLSERYDVLVTEYETRESAIGQAKLIYRLEQLVLAKDSSPIPATRTPISVDVTTPW